MKGLTLSTKEQTRLQVLNGVLERHWTIGEAAEVLMVSERHAWRLLAAYRRGGAAALAHGNRDRVPSNATSSVKRQQVISLSQERYSGMNHTHVTELLAEREGILLSRSTVRRLLVGAGLTSSRQRRPPRHRYRRQRMPQEGMLLQMDGSHHAWLEERGPRLTLLLAVDDATGTVPFALFRESEDTCGYMHLLKGIIERHGVPLAVYTDRHSVFKQTRAWKHEYPSKDYKATQVERALKELGVTQVFAHSPEAKGRVERANGTFQDRLVAELRLAGANTMAEANDVLQVFLSRFNARFAVPASEHGSAYRPLQEGCDIGGVLCVKEWRRVARDNTVQYKGRTLQIYPGLERPSYAGTRVQVQERLNGKIVVSYHGRFLTPEDAPTLAATLRASISSPVIPVESWPHDDDDRMKARPKPPPGPLAGDPIWYEDPVRRLTHRDMVRAGMERARQMGKRIGRPRVSERVGFAQRLDEVLGHIGHEGISRSQAAKELGIGYSTLTRILDTAASQTQPLSVPISPAMTPEVTNGNGDVQEEVPMVILTESLNT